MEKYKYLDIKTDSNGKKYTIYPTCCTSMYCGSWGDSCNSCRNKPILDEFEDWKEKHKAKNEDLVWCPSVYTATVQDRHKYPYKPA